MAEPIGECETDHNGNTQYFRNGKRHRKDGPAIEWADGHKEWYPNGKYITNDPLVLMVRVYKMQTIDS